MTPMLPVDPAAIELPPTQPIDMTWLIADTLAKGRGTLTSVSEKR
jgi:hypothetical protein